MLKTLCSCGLVLVVSTFAAAQSPIASPELVFAERDGMVAVEAEHFANQEHHDTRAFYLTTKDQTPSVGQDADPNHTAGASGGAYLEVLPDTRRNHSEKLIRGTNFSPEPGKLAVLTYNVHFQTPGRYYVWVRAYSTGSEDNGLHVGLDGTWPESGQRLQWCEGKHTWRWESKQRTNANHCGEAHKIFLDVQSPGIHQIHFSMREDGFEFDKWLMTIDRDHQRPQGTGPESVIHTGKPPRPFALVAPNPKPVAPQTNPADQPTSSRDRTTSPTKNVSAKPLVMPRGADGDGSVDVSGETKQWHKITLTMRGPFAHEQDNAPNPFLDYRLTVTFRHPDGTTYEVPGYFAADGQAAESSSESGNHWRAHFAPDRTGSWTYQVGFVQGKQVALNRNASGKILAPFDGATGTIDVSPSDKSGRDLRAHGRLQYVGRRYLQFAGTGRYFVKAGADAPETLLAYKDFDNTVAGKASRSPLKAWQPHVKDWREGDPTWKDGKGKGLIGAINYLSGKGCNAFSFLTYNAGGDGDNVWPFIDRDDKLHYDCSKLDQWGIVFDHGTRRGMYLHFKMQETENDDHTRGKQGGFVPESLDGGNLASQRKLYCRELIARFGHNLALNWNLGEENTQTTEQQSAMIDYIAATDPYDHHIVIHTFPEQQAKVYEPLLGKRSRLTGVSLQNSAIKDTHHQTVRWVTASSEAGKPWVVAFDESGSAAHGQCPDLGYQGYDGRDNSGKMTYTPEEVRRQTLWGTLMGGGAGVEYYFGYKYVENDLVCEDWRSRDKSWEYCRIALEFFSSPDLPLVKTRPADELIGNPKHNNEKYCLAAPGELYLVYLAHGQATDLDLRDAPGTFAVSVFNPRRGNNGVSDPIMHIEGGKLVSIQKVDDSGDDWLIVLRRTDAN